MGTTKIERGRCLYSVVDVWRGVAVGVHCFTRFPVALACFRRLQKRRNLEADDVQLFEADLNSLKPARLINVPPR